jgi:hypothetical protein
MVVNAGDYRRHPKVLEIQNESPFTDLAHQRVVNYRSETRSSCRYMRMRKAAVGEIVWYALGREPREKAEITEATDDTYAQVKIITGPLRGIEVEARWDILQRMERA